MIHCRLAILTLSLVGCAPTKPTATADQPFNRASSLVDGWMDEIQQGEPRSESALALFAWTFRYHTLTTEGHTASEAREQTRHHAEVFADAVEAEGHGAAVAWHAVGYAAMMMD